MKIILSDAFFSWGKELSLTALFYQRLYFRDIISRRDWAWIVFPV